MNKSINFSYILSDNKKTNTVTPQFYLSFRKGMLRIINTLNQGKWQYFNIKNFNFFLNFMISHLNQYIIVCIFLILHGEVYIFGYKSDQ